MLDTKTRPTTFSLAEARHIVRDLFAPNPWIYWGDFLASLAVGEIFFSQVLRVEWFSLTQLVMFVISCLLFYRASLFIHEIIHFRSGTFRAFRVVWNLLCGIPFMMPSFTYFTHLDHHRRKHYGTKLDGEYVPLGRQSPWAIVFYLSQCLVIPGVAIFRFTVITPLAWLIPPFGRWVQQHASSLVMDPAYVRPLPTPEARRVWRIQELGTLLFWIGMGWMMYRGTLPGGDPYGPHPLLRGVLPLTFMAQAYLTGVVIVLINSIRTLGAHRFLNDGHEMTFVAQLVDSINYSKRPLLTGLWAPVGLRFHALHHLFPSLPYHNLAEAHRRLMAELPADSPYRLTESDSLWESLRRLWQEAQGSATSEVRQSTAA